MKETLTAISLRKTRYSDRYSIVAAFTRERGRMSLLVADGTGRTATMNRAILMAPSIVECQADIRPGRDIHLVSQLRPAVVLTSLRSHPVKGIVGMFLAEVMNGLLRESPADKSLFDFISGALQAFDAMTDPVAVANFHLWMIYGLGRMAGVEPDLSTWRPGRWFDFHEAVFRNTMPVNGPSLDPSEAEALNRISRMTLENLGAYRFTREERNRALDVMLSYLSAHYSPIGSSSLTTLAILRGVM